MGVPCLCPYQESSFGGYSSATSSNDSSSSTPTPPLEDTAALQDAMEFMNAGETWVQ
jgi:hypothetical protein